MDSFLRQLREAQDQRFEDELEEATKVGLAWRHSPQEDSTGTGVRPGTLTIDLDLPPVDAAPKHKGPRWRLQEIRESWERVKGRAP